MSIREYNFDGLVGPTHNYSGLSRGNLASHRHCGLVSDPRAAAHQGLRKMARLHELGVAQAVLPPQPRPDIATLRRCGFSGSDAAVLASAKCDAPELLFGVSSASSMWTANAATLAPQSDTLDGRVHFTPANLVAMFHRSLEPSTTTRVLRTIFADETHFVVHDPLPFHPRLGDEGAANHTRLWTSRGALHLFAFGRARTSSVVPSVHPARQTLEASRAVARLNQLRPESCSFQQQHPEGIDQGAFHSDVLLVGNEGFLMLHEFALLEPASLLEQARSRLGDDFTSVVATEAELPVADAVATYPFNSQIVTLKGGTMLIVAPSEAFENPNARRFLERVVNEKNPISGVEFIDVRQSMSNGGGPACLRLRVVLDDSERDAIAANVFADDALLGQLGHWVEAHYRDRLAPDDLCDPKLVDESRTALDELTQILCLGSVYDFQR